MFPPHPWGYILILPTAHPQRQIQGPTTRLGPQMWPVVWSRRVLSWIYQLAADKIRAHPLCFSLQGKPSSIETTAATRTRQRHKEAKCEWKAHWTIKNSTCIPLNLWRSISTASPLYSHSSTILLYPIFSLLLFRLFFLFVLPTWFLFSLSTDFSSLLCMFSISYVCVSSLRVLSLTVQKHAWLGQMETLLKCKWSESELCTGPLPRYNGLASVPALHSPSVCWRPQQTTDVCQSSTQHNHFTFVW